MKRKVAKIFSIIGILSITVVIIHEVFMLHPSSLFQYQTTHRYK